jgi:hypothetical protein
MIIGQLETVGELDRRVLLNISALTTTRLLQPRSVWCKGGALLSAQVRPAAPSVIAKLTLTLKDVRASRRQYR